MALLFWSSSEGKGAAAQLAARPSPLQSLLADPRVVAPEELEQQVRAGNERLRIIVGLRQASENARFAAWRDRRRATAHRVRIEAYQSTVLAALPSSEFTLGHRLENQPSFSGEISVAGLGLLLANPDVATVEPDRVASMNTDQGIILMNGAAVRAQFDGSGMSIAIVDTGIQYGHAALGGGGFPNGKVIGGHDFGDNDGNPLDQHGHGTAVAGVAAGDVIFSGDFVGGVAPGSRLYALKIVAGAGPSASYSAIAAAWDWCVTHQDDDPGNPILIINTSFGGDQFTSTCNASHPALATAAANAVAAGMTLFCSAGNDGFCDAIEAPACVTNTIAVGAVYDANIGSPGWCISPASCLGSANGSCMSGWACTDSTTAADQVTCYSNSAAILDLLAPSNNAWAPALGGGYTSFGGTSAASPYAAGAAAVLIHAARSMGLVVGPSEILTYFANTGTSRLDPKSGLTKPRVDLGRAVAALGTWVDFGYSGTELGTPGNPFNTLVEGINASPGGGARVMIRAGTTQEGPTIQKAVTLVAVGGNVVIGG